MRKKSHLSLARYLMDSMKVEDLDEHRKAFLIGSILPDCTPSFLTRKHTMDESFEILKKEIGKITEAYDSDKGMGTYFCRHLGVVTHYIADYFTLPHNTIFEGNLREHCSYEKQLKTSLKEYVNSNEAIRDREESESFRTVDDICCFIEKMHGHYLDTIQEIKADCCYIVELSHRVVDAILQIFECRQQDRVVTAQLITE